MVEMALVLPLIMLFFTAMFELSRVLMLQHAADTAAYEGARAAMVLGATSSEAQQTAQQMIDAAGLSMSTIEVTPSVIEEQTSIITVRVEIPVAPNSWIVPTFFSAATARSEVSLLCERPPIVRVSAMDDLAAKKSEMQGDDTSG